MRNILTKNEELSKIIAGMREGTITVVRDENDNIKGIGVNKPGLKVSDVKYAKNVSCGQAVGETKEELAADEAALRDFARNHDYGELMSMVRVAEPLSKMSDADVDALTNYIASTIEPKVVEKEKVVERTVNTNGGNGLSDEQLANYMEVNELKAMMNRARREGDNVVKNACRRALRRKGVAC